MKVDPETRHVQLSVRELSEFSLLRLADTGPRSGRWRTDAGRRWHQSLQHELSGDFESEVAVSGLLTRWGWRFSVEGRCDLRSRSIPSLWGEIKTIEDDLPLPESELRARYRAYFRQATLYCLLAQKRERPPDQGFLLFVDISTGIRQRMDIRSEDFYELEDHFESLIEFLESFPARKQLRKKLEWSSFQSAPREGQREAFALLSREVRTSRRFGFEAPTGFGKTRLLLEQALHAIRSGTVDRIIYLTGRTSGQEQACRELETLFGHHHPLRSYRMRNLTEHAEICPVDGCGNGFCSSPDRREGRLTPISIPEHPGLPESAWERVSETSRAFTHCAYGISRAFLAFSDVWIGDYNYLFGPSSRHVFLEQPGFDPSRTWLLIDEAHNLAERVASAIGGHLDDQALLRATDELRSLGADRKLPAILADLEKTIRGISADSIADTDTTYLLMDQFEALEDSLDDARIPWRELRSETMETLLCAYSVSFLFSRDELDPVFWCPREGRLEWLPLQPETWIKECLGEFSQVIAFSATLELTPGLSDSSSSASFPSILRIEPTHSQRFRVAVDPGVETTRAHRSKYYRRTAQTAATFAEYSTGCVAVFFSSYEYAEAILTYLEAEAPHLRVALQPRGLSVSERELFARTAPNQHDLLLLMLGGTFAEAIDSFGGVISDAMIVGPGLPTLNAVNRYRIENETDREAGFHKVCRIPGMQRVNQAIGRFVRSADHTANILLHDSRFLEPAYHSLLRKDLGPIETLCTGSGLQTWLTHPHGR